MANKDIAFLRTSQVAKEDVYEHIPGKDKDKPEKRLVCLKGEVNPQTAVYTGPWWRDDLEKWVNHAYDMNGDANTEWAIVGERDLPEDFVDTNILQ